jgi:hypothetical protein
LEAQCVADHCGGHVGLFTFASLARLVICFGGGSYPEGKFAQDCKTKIVASTDVPRHASCFHFRQREIS